MIGIAIGAFIGSLGGGVALVGLGGGLKCGANELVVAFCGALAVDVGAAFDGGGSYCVSEARDAGVLFG